MMRAWLWLRSLVLRGRLEREMREEMTQHLERSVKRMMLDGMGEAAARQHAQREFGNLAYLQEEGRLARGTGRIDALWADLRFALRQFRRRKLTTFTMLVVLAMGMSISAALFSYLHSYATQPPPGVTPGTDLVRIRGSERYLDGRTGRRFTRAEFEEYTRLTEHFAAVDGWVDASVSFAAPGNTGLPRGGVAVFVTPRYFETLRVQLVRGRSLASAADEPVAVIAHEAWQAMYGGRADIVGSTLLVNGEPVTIVGVAPPRFSGMSSLSSMKVWLPLGMRAQLFEDADDGAEVFSAFGRLRPGTTLATASGAAALQASRLQAERNATTEVVPLTASAGDPNVKSDLRLMTVAFGSLALIILLVTCTNVSALLAGIAIARRREVAVRLSLGAGRGRIVRQLLTESLLLSVLAAMTALAIVATINRIAIAFIPVLPIDIAVRPQAALFTFSVALLAGLGFGLSPALHATRVTVGSALRDSSSSIAGSQTRLQRGLVVAQIAFTQPLAVAVVAVLLTLFTALASVTGNPQGERIVDLRVQGVASAQLPALRERVAGLPGVDGVVEHNPTRGFHAGYTARLGSGRDTVLTFRSLTVAPGYFDVMGLPLALGRQLTAADTVAAGGTSVVIPERLARALWPGVSPLGRRLLPPTAEAGGGPEFVVVGVVDEGPVDPRRSRMFVIYVPPAAGAASGPRLLVRTRGDAIGSLDAIREAVHAEAPDAAITTLRSLAQTDREVRRDFTLALSALSVTGLLALGLAAIGLYAVVALAVNHRTNEIAVRMAVGASAGGVVRRFVREGLTLTGVGMFIGLPLSLLLLKMLEGAVLPMVDIPATGAIAAAGVLAVAAVAAWLPARRAATIEPARILRQE